MPEFFQKLDRKISIKWRMVIYLGGLLVVSSWYLNFPGRILWGLGIVALYAAYDLVWTKIRDKLWYLPVSSFISGFILALVAIPSPPLWFLFFAPLLAVFSKQFIKWPGKRHLFNPASFALLTLSFFTPAVSWWGVSWGKIPLVIVIAVGLVILYRQKRFHETVPFLLSYLFFLALLFLWNDVSIKDLFKFLFPQIIDGTTLFFATVMLIEPLTSQFPTRQSRVFYGASVGFFAVLITFLSSLASGLAATTLAKLDPLLIALLLGNLFSYMIFVVRKLKVSTT